jgi:STE24 endopeptidase
LAFLSGDETPATEALFPSEAVERGRRYHRPLYVALAADLALALGTLAVLAFGPPGDTLHGLVDGLPWPLETAALAVLVTVVLALVRLPLALWRGWIRERRWELSTQSLGGFLADRAKGLGVAAVLSASMLVGLAALVRLFPSAWPLAAAAAGAALVLALAFVAPVVLEPLFNRFEPLRDEELARRLRELAERAGAPVRDVLVADASRRTAKANAYVSGFGATRRLVLYDTLLDSSPPEEVAAVVAHELGHRRERHVLRATLLGMAGAAGAAVALWPILGDDAGDPRNVPLVLLVLGGLELLALPPGAAVSRRWERAADRFALRLTGDRAGLEAAFRRLAETNVADLDPPWPVRVLLATHPPLPERVRAARTTPLSAAGSGRDSAS